MNMAKEISEVCRQSNNRGLGVMPWQVCSYCFECPIATIVAGVSDTLHQQTAREIPDESIGEIRTWLDGLQQKLR